MTKTVGELPVGERVEFLRLWGEPVVWRVIGTGLEGFPDGAVTLWADRIIAVLAFDAKEPESEDSYARSSGNPDWEVSNLRQWLNSDGEAGKWFTPRHATDAAPSEENTGGYNGYDYLPGFLHGATDAERGLVVPMTRRYAVDAASGKTVTDDISLLTTTEQGMSVGIQADSVDGTLIPAFSDKTMTNSVTSTPACAEHNGYRYGSPINYWTPTSVTVNQVSIIQGSTSNSSSVYPTTLSLGVKPVCCVRDDAMISDMKNERRNHTFVLGGRQEGDGRGLFLGIKDVVGWYGIDG